MATLKKNTKKHSHGQLQGQDLLRPNIQFWMETEIILVLGWQGEESRSWTSH